MGHTAKVNSYIPASVKYNREDEDQSTGQTTTAKMKTKTQAKVQKKLRV